MFFTVQFQPRGVEKLRLPSFLHHHLYQSGVYCDDIGWFDQICNLQMSPRQSFNLKVKLENAFERVFFAWQVTNYAWSSRSRKSWSIKMTICSGRRTKRAVWGTVFCKVLGEVSYEVLDKVLGEILGKVVGEVRVEICRNRHDRRSCKICASCVKFPGKQRDFSHNLPKTTRFTHTKCVILALKLLNFYTFS